jgi:hypothetical protein
MPGDALGKLSKGLADALRGERVQPVGMPWVERLAEPEQPQGVTFNVTKATLRLDGPNGDTIHLREVYWGDLSRVKSSIVGLVYALFDFIFGLHHVVEAATKEVEDKPGSRAGRLAGAALWMARGPMFALNVLAAAVCGTYALILGIGGAVGPLPFAPAAAAVLGSIAVLGVGVVSARISSDSSWSTDTWMVMVVLSPWSLVATFLLLHWLEKSLDAYIYVITTTMTIGAALMAGLGLFSLVTAAWARWRKHGQGRDIDGPIAVITFCTALSLGLFVLAVIGGWTLVIKALSEDLESRMTRCLNAAPYSLQTCMADKSTDPAALLASRIEAGVHLLPFVVLAFFLLALVFFALVAANWRLERRDAPYRHRYIVNRWLYWYVAVTFFYGLAFIGLAYWLITSGLSNWKEAPAFLKAFVESIPKWQAVNDVVTTLKGIDQTFKAGAIAATTLLIAFVVSQRVQFLTALDLVLDVIAHFRTAGAGGKKHPVVWRRMQQRFQAVVTDTMAQTKADRLVILSHSQGTTIAAHCLGVLTIDGESVDPKLEDVRLVTMGSPIDHLYRYYMPTRYVLDASNKSVSQWLNIYRRDDFIGTSIEGLRDEFPSNRCIGTGGHTDYWVEPSVITAVMAIAQCPAPATSQAHALAKRRGSGVNTRSRRIRLER